MIQLNVSDMTCAHCASVISKSIKNADPAATVDVAIAEKLVCVESGLSLAELVACIAKAGYTAQPLDA